MTEANYDLEDHFFVRGFTTNPMACKVCGKPPLLHVPELGSKTNKMRNPNIRVFNNGGVDVTWEIYPDNGMEMRVAAYDNDGLRDVIYFSSSDDEDKRIISIMFPNGYIEDGIAEEAPELQHE